MDDLKKIVIEKRIPLFTADTLAELSKMDVKIEGGSGRVWATLLVAPENEKEVLRLARAEGYAKAEEA